MHLAVDAVGTFAVVLFLTFAAIMVTSVVTSNVKFFKGWPVWMKGFRQRLPPPSAGAKDSARHCLFGNRCYGRRPRHSLAALFHRGKFACCRMRHLMNERTEWSSSLTRPLRAPCNYGFIRQI